MSNWANAITRIIGKEKVICGAGFLVTPDEVATCAHVISSALNLSQRSNELPIDSVSLDFPLTSPLVSRNSRVTYWNIEQDIAVLRLEKSVSEVEPPKLIYSDDMLWGHSFRAFGFPKGYEGGVWSAGVLLAKNAYGWLQLSGNDVGYRIQPGFSGTPVWDEVLQGIVGIVTAADISDVVKSAFLIPSSSLKRTWLPLSVTADNRTTNSTKKTIKVFLCHSSYDKPAVRHLFSRLQQDGFSPWLDEENLLAGERWQTAIPRAIRESDAVVVCLSQSSISKSGYVQKEIRYALDIAEEKPENTIFLIPTKLEECKIPERLGNYHYVNLFEEKGYQRLIKSLNTCGGGSPKEKEIKFPIEADIFDTLQPIRIMLTAATPMDVVPLHINKEFQIIENIMRMGGFRDRYRIYSQLSTNLFKLRSLLHDIQPQIVHFSGHGTTSGLVLEDSNGKSVITGPDELASIFSSFAHQIKCVILNTSYSEITANAIAEHIKYTIGISRAITDEASIDFTSGFYRAISEGMNIEDSYKIGCVQIKLHGVMDQETPVLIRKRFQ